MSLAAAQARIRYLEHQLKGFHECPFADRFLALEQQYLVKCRQVELLVKSVNMVDEQQIGTIKTMARMVVICTKALRGTKYDTTDLDQITFRHQVTTFRASVKVTAQKFYKKHNRYREGQKAYEIVNHMRS